MSQVAELVRLFYEQLWNQKNLAIANEILDEQVSFRGSLGQQMVGRSAVCEYVKSVTSSLANYTCDIQDLVVEKDKAVARVQFSGIHTGEFMGYKPTGKEVDWVGAAFFESHEEALTKIWVLADLQSLRSKLERIE